MDCIVTELAAALPVVLLPGAGDPSNAALPQQPLHSCLFPGAAPYESAFLFVWLFFFLFLCACVCGVGVVVGQGALFPPSLRAPPPSCSPRCKRRQQPTTPPFTNGNKQTN
jgi:hypothetical protein